MSKYVAFLRAINVGGRNISMEDLKAHFVALGFQNVETYIASGNVIFESESEDRATLEREIEEHLLDPMSYEVTTFLRTPGEMAAIAAFCRRMPKTEALNVGFLKEELTPEDEAKLMAMKTPIDDFWFDEREIYWACRKKQSESKFSNVVFEKRFKLRTTFRGANTIAKLAAKLAG